MAYTFKNTWLGAVLLATHMVLAIPLARHGHHHHHHNNPHTVQQRDTGSCPVQQRTSCDFNTPDPSNWPASYSLQWCGMITNELAGLQTGETAALVTAGYAQAYPPITAAPTSALPNVDAIIQDPQARAALTQMKANFPAFGSMDLTAADIATVYAPALAAATAKTGVPAAMLVEVVWTESKGHPLVYGGLTQMDYIAWGQMADADADLRSRYLPTDNIVAAAMFLAKAKETYGGTWETVYRNHYQDPSAKA